MEDAGAYAKHAGRKNRINESDLVTIMYRCGPIPHCLALNYISDATPA